MDGVVGDRPVGGAAASGSYPSRATWAAGRGLPIQLGDVQQVIRWTLIASITVNVGCQYFDGHPGTALLSAMCVVALIINRQWGASITAVTYLLTLNPQRAGAAPVVRRVHAR